MNRNPEVIGDGTGTVAPPPPTRLTENQGNEPARLRCLVADRSPVFAQGLTLVLESNGFTTVGCVDSPAGIPAFLRGRKIDVVLSCFEPLADALSVAEVVTDVPVLILSSSESDEAIVEAIRSRALGLLRKDAAEEELAGAVRAVGSRQPAFPAGWESTLLRLVGVGGYQPGGDETMLTSREQHIVELLVVGYSNKQVARRLGIAEQTVKNHVRHIMTKLGVSSRVQLCRWALEPTVRSAQARGRSGGAESEKIQPT